MSIRGEVNVAGVGVDSRCRFADTLKAGLFVSYCHTVWTCNCFNTLGIRGELPWVEFWKSINDIQRA